MPRYEGSPDVRSLYEDERRRGGCFRPVTCLCGLVAVTFLLLMLATGCEMMFGSSEGSSGRAQIINTSGMSTCVIRRESKSYNEPYLVASDAVLDQCRHHVGREAVVRFDSAGRIVRIEPALR